MTDFKNVDADALSPVGKIKLEEAVSGYTVYKEFEEMLKGDPAKRNEDFLMQLLQDNKDTEYGKKYNFADIHSIEDYQKKRPRHQIRRLCGVYTAYDGKRRKQSYLRISCKSLQQILGNYGQAPKNPHVRQGS